MKTQGLFRFLNIFAAIALALMCFGTQPATAAPGTPVPVSPAPGSTIVIPTFTWQAATGAVKYEVQVGRQSDDQVIWSDQTTNLTITPVNASVFANIALYWQVRAYDSLNATSPWSSKVNFTKQLPAPTQISPTSAVTTPTFEWQALQGAASYRLEVSSVPNFQPVDDTYDTYNTRLTPVNTFAHGAHYWRVTGMDADGNLGTPASGFSITKDLPPPVLTTPYNGHPNVHIPVFQWQVVPEAAYYQVEVSASSTFVPVLETYTTYNTSLTPTDTFAHGTYYWRVSSVDADGHAGTPSGAFTFTKALDAPVLVSPGVDATISVPTMQWEAVVGAAYYRVELSDNSTFIPIRESYDTNNLKFTPTDGLATGMYYWRVSGVDAGGNVGNNNWRRFTLTAQGTPTDPTPQLLTPAAGETITSDPTFSWTRVVGADNYRLIVSREADMSPIYDQVVTDYNSYTPYTTGTAPGGSYNAYPNGTYYWKVQARAGTSVISESEGRSFTKQEVLPLTSPANGASGLLVDPTFQWQQIVGARTYRLVVSRDISMSPIYDQVVTDYNSYTPYTEGTYNAYPNDTYYWRVEARNSSGTVIATSETRSFTKAEVLSLTSPANGASGLTADPTFAWSRIVGAKTYRLVVSRDISMSPIYDQVVSDYTSYTPYTAGSYNAYPNGTYYWRVEARNSGGTVIATSAVWSFTRQQPMPLIAPPNGAIGLRPDPTFQWGQVLGAKTYRWIVSREPDMSPIYDQVVTDYPLYTPYTGAGSYSNYANRLYYWQVEARNSGGTVIATSDMWTFFIGHAVYVPIVKK